MRRLCPNMPHESIDLMLANSYRDFHAKGLDYICLARSPSETWKLYFFNNVKQAAEVVYPHDHRYDFTTEVLVGDVLNITYSRGWFRNAKTYNRFEWRTPLNGGSGFTFAGETILSEARSDWYKADPRHQPYKADAKTVHTIRVTDRETVLLLRQFEDRVPLDEPTCTFSSGDPPTMDGLYRRWTADDLLKKLDSIQGILHERNHHG